MLLKEEFAIAVPLIVIFVLVVTNAQAVLAVMLFSLANLVSINAPFKLSTFQESVPTAQLTVTSVIQPILASNVPTVTTGIVKLV